MPFIHVKSLPFESPLDIGAVVEGLTKDFAQEMGIGLEHVTATWEFYQSRHYAVAGQAQSRQSEDSHPVLVDLLSPDFNQPVQIEKMLQTVASSIAHRAQVPLKNIFINYRPAHSGQVFDAGEVVKW